MLFPVIASILLAVVWGSTLSVIKVEHTTADRAAATSTRELAETYEAQVVRVLREIDQSLKFIKFAYESKGGRISLAELKAQGLLPPDLLFSVSIANARGDIIASTRPPETTNVADQAFFSSLRQKEEVAVSPPLPTRAAGEWRIHFSRRIAGADGSFAGAAIVSVSATL